VPRGCLIIGKFFKSPLATDEAIVLPDIFNSNPISEGPVRTAPTELPLHRCSTASEIRCPNSSVDVEVVSTTMS